LKAEEGAEPRTLCIAQPGGVHITVTHSLIIDNMSRTAIRWGLSLFQGATYNSNIVYIKLTLLAQISTSTNRTMSISRTTPSIISVTNENTFALVNVNADFSLIKLEAPSEFRELGRSLTHHRREMAEEGAVHRTARRLGALFESIAPLAPHLIRAYG
jgi:hypothetical protein